MKYQNSGGIQNWERYESADLATCDWSRIGRLGTDTIQTYAEELDKMMPKGVGMVIAGGTGAGKTHIQPSSHHGP